MADLVCGVLSLLIAVAFLVVLAHAVPSPPLLIVILLGLAAMVTSLIETVRGDQRR
jgi:hypothetical protein